MGARDSASIVYRGRGLGFRVDSAASFYSVDGTYQGFNECNLADSEPVYDVICSPAVGCLLGVCRSQSVPECWTGVWAACIVFRAGLVPTAEPGAIGASWVCNEAPCDILMAQGR